MTRQPYRAVVFDLFNTIVRWSPGRLPLLELEGRSLPSTVPLLLPELRNAFGDSFEQATWLGSYFEVLREIELERSQSAVEITCRERFSRTLDRLGLPSGSGRDAIAERLTRVHMAAVRSVTAAPPEFADAVRRVATRYRVGIVSNFDDSRTGHEIVADTGLSDLFEAVVISADVAVRKPHPRIFRRMFELMRLEPPDVLFVGDTPAEDVAGAQAVGMPVAWLSRGKKELPPDLPEPDFTIPDVTALPPILGFE